MGAQDFKGDRVEVGAEQGARFVTICGSEQDQEGFLREFFGMMRIGDATTKETVDRLLVAEEQCGQGFGGALGERQHEFFVAGAASCGVGGGRRVVHGGGRESLRV